MTLGLHLYIHVLAKKRWQEYTEELYKKDLHDPDNHDGVITHLEPDILECQRSLLPSPDHFQFALIYGPDIPGSYAMLLFTASDLVSITSHIHKLKILRRDGNNTQKNCTKRIFTTRIITMV